MAGVAYPARFGPAFSTSAGPPSAAISPVVTFPLGSPAPLLLVGLPINVNATGSRRSAGCPAGTEWRYALANGPANSACACPANALCSGATNCSVTALAGDKWQVR